MVSGVAFGNGLYVLTGEVIGSGSGGAAGGGTTGASGALGASSLDDVPTIWTSADLKTWSPLPAHAPGFEGVAFGNGVFVLTGNDGAVSYSADGANWIRADSGVAYPLNHVIFANGKFYASGGIGTLLVSSNGREWSPVPCSSSMFLYDVCATQDSLIAVGYYGAIVEAPFDLYFAAPTRVDRNQRIYGATRERLIIESSSDLNSWNRFMMIEHPANPTEFSLPSGTNRFFRARTE
jgi:hypothetical protein